MAKRSPQRPSSRTLTAMLLREELPGDLILVTELVASAVRRVAAELRVGALHHMLRATGATNVQGERVQRFDQYANQAFLESLEAGGLVARVVSEEMDVPAQLAAHGPWTLLFDPLDGSSNLDSGAAVGSIFAIRGPDAPSLGTGADQRLAGYALYGPSTLLVLAAPGGGVRMYALDPPTGEFMLVHEGMRMPASGPVVAANMAHAPTWAERDRAFLERALGAPASTLRYSGALVADFHRILLEGGCYLYPGDVAHPEGKLRLLYEAAPLALVAEEAGGAATTGGQAVMAVHPASVHERVPLIVGSREVVAGY
jgi:fructose-1,6-bisphosphatase I